MLVCAIEGSFPINPPSKPRGIRPLPRALHGANKQVFSTPFGERVQLVYIVCRTANIRALFRQHPELLFAPLNPVPPPYQGR